MAFVDKLRNRILGEKKSKISYSQCGEDIIMEFILDQLHIDKPLYLDIGAHHPVYLSNTYKFYKKGGHGVCIEPDPTLFKLIKNKRPRDICLNVGIGVTQQAQVDFYVMSCRTLNTFCKDEAERYQSYGKHKIDDVMQIPLININDLIEKNFVTSPNIVSLDVEGLDLEILYSFDFSKYRPEVFCVETITYTEDKSEEKIEAIIQLMTSKNYFVYADTYINTIFLDRTAWADR